MTRGRGACANLAWLGSDPKSLTITRLQALTIFLLTFFFTASNIALANNDHQYLSQSSA